MKLISLILIASSLAVVAEAPRKDPLTKYRQLWEKSLVTLPPDPPIVDPVPEESELDDYVLAGWTQTSQGYLVSLINTKDPKLRKTIAPGMPNSEGYQVLEVKRDPMNYKASEVLVKVGSNQKWIGYEDKYLTLQQPRQAPKKPTNQKQPITQKPPIPTSNQKKNTSTERQPRVRRVPVPPKK